MREHGTRAKYVVEKCRCDACREANRRYAEERAARLKELAAKVVGRTRKKVVVVKAVHTTGCKRGEVELRPVRMKRPCPGVGGRPCVRDTYLKKNSTGNLCSYCRESLIKLSKYVDASKAQTHLLALSAVGVGFKAVSDRTGLFERGLQEIANGVRSRINQDTEKLILAVTADDKADGARVDAKETWRKLKAIIQKGWKKAEISRELGMNGRALQVGTAQVLVSTARGVDALYEEVMKGKSPRPTCKCGILHRAKWRQQALKKLLPNSLVEIMDVLPCMYRPGKDGRTSAMLLQDLRAIGAKGTGGWWWMRGGHGEGNREGRVEAEREVRPVRLRAHAAGDDAQPGEAHRLGGSEDRGGEGGQEGAGGEPLDRGEEQVADHDVEEARPEDAVPGRVLREDPRRAEGRLPHRARHGRRRVRHPHDGEGSSPEHGQPEGQQLGLVGSEGPGVLEGAVW